jgi:hypothetical protein
MSTPDTGPLISRAAAAAREILAAIDEDSPRDGLLTGCVRGLFRNELSSRMEAIRMVGMT